MDRLNTGVLIAAALAVLITMAMATARAWLGPSVYDRILAVNMFGTKTVLIIAILGFLTGRPDFLDIALVYALINFIGIIAVLKFIRYGELGWAPATKAGNTAAGTKPNSGPET